MARNVTYLYPEEQLAGKLKIYQDRSSQIRAFMFARSTISKIAGYDFSDNYSIYFLVSNDTEDDMPSIYIGQSENGIKRILNHVNGKSFWTHGFMFVTENNGFDKQTIDYLEWKFIQLFKKSDYYLDNKDMRIKQPNISIYDQPVMDSYVEQIAFLLSIEGVVFSLEKKDKNIMSIYYPKSKVYRNKAKMGISDGNFYLLTGSIIRKMEREYSKSITKRINLLQISNKINEKEGNLVAKQDILCRSPSGVAELITGIPQNGWLFFDGLEELRLTEKKSDEDN